jgi:RNA polymerase sigma factor (sigma-70 family)
MRKSEDAYIIEQIKLGNTAVFAELIERYKQGAYTICVRIVGNQADAEEACQEAFIKAFRSLKGFRYESSFSTWLYRIMFNTSISFLRKKKIRTGPYDEALPQHLMNNSWEENVHQEETKWKKRLVREAVHSLDVTDRAIVTLYYTFDHSVNEIARITELSEANVKVRLHRARLKLQEEINARINIYSII